MKSGARNEGRFPRDLRLWYRSSTCGDDTTAGVCANQLKERSFDASLHFFPTMAYVICQPCIGTKDKACVEVCPVDCVQGKEEDPQMYINPEECIDCAACEPVCPVLAIFIEEEVPDEWKNFIELNRRYFRNA